MTFSLLQKLQSIHSFQKCLLAIVFLLLLLLHSEPYMVTGAHPSCLGRRRSSTLDKSAVFRRVTSKDKQPFALELTTTDNLELPMHLTRMMWQCGKRLRYQERTHADSGRTCHLYNSPRCKVTRMNIRVFREVKSLFSSSLLLCSEAYSKPQHLVLSTSMQLFCDWRLSNFLQAFCSPQKHQPHHSKFLVLNR